MHSTRDRSKCSGPTVTEATVDNVRGDRVPPPPPSPTKRVAEKIIPVHALSRDNGSSLSYPGNYNHVRGQLHDAVLLPFRKILSTHRLRGRVGLGANMDVSDEIKFPYSCRDLSPRSPSSKRTRYAGKVGDYSAGMCANEML